MPTVNDGSPAQIGCTHIDPDQLDALHDDDTVYALVDVRERGEYAQGHIPGACPLPRGLAEILAPTLVPWRTVPVVVYCDDGHRSRLAATTLTSLGYGDVRVLDGGVERWRSTGRVLEEGVNVLGKTYGEKVSATGGVTQVEPDELAELQNSGDLLVIDARTRIEYERGHVPGAISLPGGELPAALLSIPADQRPGTIVVHCAGRTRSILGARLVMDVGFDRVFALRNGTMAWRMSGRNIEYEANAPTVAANPEGAERAAAFARRYIDGLSVSEWNSTDVADAHRDRRSIYLLDVRQAEEFVAAHPAGSINCPVGQLANAVDEQLAVRRAAIVCYSDDETRARIGAGLLHRIGYPDVGWLRGGLNSWRADGLPVVAGRTPSYPPELEAELADCDTIDADRLQHELAEGVAVVDVRRSSEFALAHIPSSTWIPRGDLERRIGRSFDADADLVFVSDRGIRAALAARTARDAGYPKARVLQAGFEGWRTAGGVTESGLDGADVSLREAKEDAELVAPRPSMLERNREDMVRYLTWEEQLGSAFESERQ